MKSSKKTYATTENLTHFRKKLNIKTWRLNCSIRKSGNSIFLLKKRNWLLPILRPLLLTASQILKTKNQNSMRLFPILRKRKKVSIKKSEKVEAIIEDRLLTAYKRIRSNARNGLAVVPVQRDACGGCFNQIPPQRQLDIKSRKEDYCM